MPWMKVEEQIGRHPKHLKVDPAASWLWLCGIGYCRGALTDGFITRAALSLLGHFKPEPTRFAAQLVAAGLWRWDDEQHGWWVHDYLAMNPSKEDVAEMRAKDSERKRHRESNGNPSGIQQPSKRASRAPAAALSDLSDLSDLSGSGSSEGERERKPDRFVRTSSLIQPMRGNIAIPGRVPMRGEMLEELAGKLGGVDAEARVRQWAMMVLDGFQDDEPIPDSSDSFAWWRRQARSLLPQSRPETKADRVSQANQQALAAVIARRRP